MTPELLIVLLVIIIGFSIVAYLINKRQNSSQLLDVIRILEKNSKEDRSLLIKSLTQNTQAVNERLDKTSQVLSGVQRNIGELSEIGRGMKELHDLLKSPKARGSLGEHILNELLSQLLPNQVYETQYRFKSGSVVDAIIQTNQGIIPIDSKFPFDSYKKYAEAETQTERRQFQKTFVIDVKKHIRDISTKYINPDEETVDYAIMYVPSEVIYYEIINSEELYDYSTDKHVVTVSPTTFYAFIKAVLMSFEGQKIQEQAKEIVRALSAIQKDYEEIDSSLGVLNKHLTNAHNTLNLVLSNIGRMGRRIKTVRQLEKPKG